MSDKENVVQQAQIWAQEARTQRAIVLSILRFFGLPERDYEALTLIQQQDSECRARALKALDLIEAIRDEACDHPLAAAQSAAAELREALRPRGVAIPAAPSLQEVIAAALEALEDNDNHAATVILKTALRNAGVTVARHQTEAPTHADGSEKEADQP